MSSPNASEDSVPGVRGTPALRDWLPVVGLTCSTFVFNTSEFIPIGLLTSIAQGLDVSEAMAGMLISAYAWVVAIMSLPLMLACSRFDYRKLLFGVVALFVVSHAASAVAVNYPMLLASRFGVACAHAVFWSIVTPLAVRVAPAGHRAAALSIVITGTAVALIVGLPLGRMLGLWLGWRMTFGIICAAAAAVLVLLWRVMPSVSPGKPVSVREVPAILSNPSLLGLYGLIIVLVTGQYTACSYIEPFLSRVAGISETAVTWMLAIFGLVGFAGSWTFSHCYEGNKRRLQQCAVFGIPLMLALLLPATWSVVTVVICMVLWGFAMSMLNLCFQAVVIELVPRGTAIAMSLYSGLFNVGIASGAIVGGICTDYDALRWIGLAGFAFCAAAAVFYQFWLMPRLRRAGAA